MTGRKLILGGVNIPFEKGLEGHSDADVLSHAIGDALLGAAALGDIGLYFPDNDPGLKNISSLKMLKKIVDLLDKKKFIVGNVDSTIVVQQPKVAVFIDQMRENIAPLLGVCKDSVAVKATTTEGMGFTGSGQGISAYATVLIYKQK